VILLIGSLPNALGFIPHGSSVRRSSCRTGNVCGHPNSSRLRSHVSKVGSGYRRTTSVRVGVPRYADHGGTLSRARRDRRAGRSEAQDLSPLPLQPPHARPSFLGSPFRLLRRCRTSPSRCANHHRPRQAPLTDRGRGPSLRERGRDDTESLIWPRSRALEAGAILGYRSRRAASRIGDAAYSEPYRGCSDRCSRLVTSRTLDLRAGLSGPRARGARTTGEYTSPFARLTRPPNATRRPPSRRASGPRFAAPRRTASGSR
jgi:hypothetical protein